MFHKFSTVFRTRANHYPPENADPRSVIAASLSLWGFTAATPQGELHLNVRFSTEYASMPGTFISFWSAPANLFAATSFRRMRFVAA